MGSRRSPSPDIELASNATTNVASTTTASQADTTSDVRRTNEVRRRRALLKKIDLRLIPLLFVVSFVQVLDKIAITFADIMGLQKDLQMAEQDFTVLTTAFLVAYILGELPTIYLLSRYPVSRVLGTSIFVTAILSCCTAAASDLGGMTVLRILLGMCEAAVAPSMALIISQWYPGRETAPRFGLLSCGSASGYAVGGIISWIAQHMHHHNKFTSWRVMFFSIGISNAILALFVFFTIPRSVQHAKILTNDEEIALQKALAIYQGGNGRQSFDKKAIAEALRDPAVWLLFLVTTLALMPVGGIAAYGPTMIVGYGISAEQAVLLGIPFSLISIASCLIATCSVRWGFPRWLGSVCVLTLAMFGTGLLSFSSDRNAILAGTWLTGCTPAILALASDIATANTSGYTKKVTVYAAIQIGFGVSSIVGPRTFLSREAPRYTTAAISMFACAAAAIPFTACLRLVYGFRNRKSEPLKREQLLELRRDASKLQRLVADRDLTDRKNQTFVYSY